jgi:hypothetical protein
MRHFPANCSSEKSCIRRHLLAGHADLRCLFAGDAMQYGAARRRALDLIRSTQTDHRRKYALTQRQEKPADFRDWFVVTKIVHRKKMPRCRLPACRSAQGHREQGSQRAINSTRIVILVLIELEDTSMRRYLYVCSILVCCISFVAAARAGSISEEFISATVQSLDPTQRAAKDSLRNN